MAYRVRIEGNEAIFKFANIDEALNFESMAAEYGSIEDYHYEKENNTHVRVSDGWRPVICTFSKEEEEEETHIYADGGEVVI